jgi:hypothetical protein
MMRGARRIFFALFTFCAVDARADDASRSADNIARGEEFFRQGTRSFEAERYAEAYGALRTAFDLSPSYRTAAGLGQVELHLEQYRDAAGHLAYCLRHFPADGDAEARRHVEQGLDQAREHIAALRIRTNVEKAKVTLDGASVGEAPLDGLVFVDPGTHTVAASLDGYSTATESVDAPLRTTSDVSLSLGALPQASLPASRPESSPGPVATPEAPEKKKDATAGLSPSTWAIIIGGSLTAVALGTTIVFEVNRASADSDVHDLRGDLGGQNYACHGPAGENPTCTALHDAADRRDAASTGVTAFAITTGVLAAATVTTALVLPSTAVGKDHAGQSAAFGIASLPGGARLTVGGSF